MESSTAVADLPTVSLFEGEAFPDGDFEENFSLDGELYNATFEEDSEPEEPEEPEETDEAEKPAEPAEP